MSFDGTNDYVEMSDSPSLDITDKITVSAWIYQKSRANYEGIASKYGDGAGLNSYLLYIAEMGKPCFLITSAGSIYHNDQAGNTDNVPLNQWSHLAGTFDGRYVKIYRDGELKHTKDIGRFVKIDTTAQPVWIGRYGNTQYFSGSIDDVRIYDRALSAEEIRQLYWQGLGEKAFNPNPADGAANIDPNVIFSWSPGKNALSHDVYLGLDYNDVNNATPDSNEYMGNFDVNSFDPNGLAIDTTYYWRIDEKNAAGTAKGDVWSFTTWVEPNLISWWKFDEGVGTIAYDSAGNNHGTIYGATWTTGQIDGALSFDGVNDYVTVADNESQQIKTNQIALSAWIKLGADVGNTQRRIICKQQSTPRCWGLELFGNGYGGATGNQLNFHDSSGTAFYNCMSQTHLSINRWYHVSVTDNAGKIRIYINSLPDKACDGGYGIPSQIAAPITIGRTNPDSLFFFNGIIDDVRFYDRALSAEEIWQLYQGGY